MDGTCSFARLICQTKILPAFPIWDGDDLIVMTALSHVSLNTREEVGDVSGFLFGLRIVETRREPGKVYARTLRLGEEDTGARVHVEPGEQVEFEEGAISVELDYIDSLETTTESALAPLTPVPASWFSIGETDPAKMRYLLAASRRLDETNRRFGEIETHRKALGEDGLTGPAIRSHANALLGSVESALIGLGRTVDMADRANSLLGSNTPVPQSITTHKTAVVAIRNAYEHIEDRALGLERGQPHTNALTIFDYRRLIEENIVVYGPHALNLDTDAPTLLSDARAFLKAVAGNPDARSRFQDERGQASRIGRTRSVDASRTRFSASTH